VPNRRSNEPRMAACSSGGIFTTLEQAAIRGSFERLFGTPHGVGLGQLAAAAGLPHAVLARPADLPGQLAGSGLRIVEVRTDREAEAALRARLHEQAVAAVRAVLAGQPAQGRPANG